MTEQKALAIRVRFPDMKRAQLLGSDGFLTMRRMHAAMFWDRAEADSVAATVLKDFPKAVVTVGKL